jgi:hypothetical protein
MSEKIEAEIRAKDVPSEEASFTRLGESFLEAIVHLEDFAVDIVVTTLTPHRITSDDHAFNDGVRVITKDVPILEGARFTLVRITG